MPELDRIIAGISCREVLTDLSNFLDGGLSDPRVEQIRAHLHECRECDQFGGMLGELVAEVRRQLSEPATLEPDVEQRLRDRLRAARIEG